MRAMKFWIAIATGALLLSAAACKVSTHEGEDGNKNVEVKTPFGGLNVNNKVDAKDLGMAIYPGATPVPKAGKDDNDEANVNLGFGGFGLKVVTLKYASTDAPDKLLAFYRRQLKTYGKVLECRGDTSDGVRVNNGDNLNQPVKCDDDANSSVVVLKAGTQGNQHVAKIEPDGKGAKFTLLYLKVKLQDEDEKKDTA